MAVPFEILLRELFLHEKFSNTQHTFDIFRGMWPITVPLLITATAYLSLVLVGSLEHIKVSPIAVVRISL